ncbi:hypothetical protein E4H12_02210 [Candidatus Thorarchaeota archaeon]|nr:MAG: hypothetical protein E4H12_02210 [Candidatus Thorarchaeota archaeon]
MVDIKSQIEDYLNLLDMNHTWNFKEKYFELIFSERKDNKSAKPDDENTFQYSIYIRPDSKWIQIYTDVYPLSSIPEKKRDAVFLELLLANRKYAEVCFDYNEERKFIGSSQEMMVQGLDFDGFREEFLAVPWAVKKFWTEIAPKFKLE